MMVSEALAHFQCRIDSVVMEFCPPCLLLLFSDGGAEEGEDEQKRQLASRSETCV